jgi:hypothetical protein
VLEHLPCSMVEVTTAVQASQGAAAHVAGWLWQRVCACAEDAIASALCWLLRCAVVRSARWFVK